MIHRVLLLIPAMLLVLLQTGCESGPPAGTVKGTVKLDGVVLTAGNVQFLGDKGTGTANIQPDGTYKCTDAPLGATKVTVVVPNLPGGAAPLGGKDMPKTSSGPSVQVPEKYGNAATSGLTLTVKSGSQTFDISLTK
jgi:hypothetical protein